MNVIVDKLEHLREQGDPLSAREYIEALISLNEGGELERLLKAVSQCEFLLVRPDQREVWSAYQDVLKAAEPTR